MKMGSSKIFLLLFVFGLIHVCVKAGSLKKVDQQERNDVYDLDDSDEVDDEKSQNQPIIEPTTKKQGIIESIVNKLSAIKPKPINLTNPLKKPLHDLQEFLKPKPIPPVTKTKTVRLEVTKMITKHPICVASTHIKPACSALHGNVISYKNNAEDNISQDDVVEKVEQLLKQVAPPAIQPTKAVQAPEDLATTLYDNEPSYDVRNARFIKFDTATPSLGEVKSEIKEDTLEDDEDKIDDEGRHLLIRGETQYVTKTLWVTKVQTTTDYKVTATLVPQNCVPLDLYFPQCSTAPAPAQNQFQFKPFLWKTEGEKKE